MEAFSLYVFLVYIAAGCIHGDPREYSLSGYFVSSPPPFQNQFRRNAMYTSVEVSHLLAPHFQLGGRANLDWLRDEEGRSDTRTVLSLAANTLVNPRSNYIAFFSVSPGIAFGGFPGYWGDDETKLQAELGGGLKVVVGQKAAIRVEYRYRIVRNSKVGNIVSDYARDYQGPRRGAGRKEDFTSHGVYFGVSIFVNRRVT
ncbi:MAG: hypothetical protein IT369_03730 [Candidatus Latescibacteria bacterium]|nr:hypothetical protein [Candidatus Latescibacterota bacterium]